MRKIELLLIFIFIFILCTGCSCLQQSTEPSNTLTDLPENTIQYDEMFTLGDLQIRYESGIYYDKNWSNQTGTHKADAIPNRETALNVALQIFKGMSKNANEESYIPQSVFFDEQDEIWIINFAPPINEGASVMLTGNCFSIALRKADGAVMRIWAGE